MNNKNFTYAIFCAVVIVILLVLMSNVDAKDQSVVQAHKEDVLRLAKEEALERKRDFNKLAFEAERMTGIKGAMK